MTRLLYPFALRLPCPRNPIDWIRSALFMQGLGWSVALYLPGDTLGLTASFRILRDIMTEQHWAWTWSAEALGCLCMLFLQASRMRVGSSLLTCGFNLLLAICFASNPIPSPGFPEHIAFLMLSMFLVLHERQAA